MRIALIADIHGNSWALEAVLEDIRRRRVTEILNLGDSVYGPLDPRSTVDRLIETGIPSLRGNQDRILIEPPPDNPHPTFTYTMSCLGEGHLEWLRGRPCTIELGGLFCCHGSPADDCEYLTEAVNASGARLKSATEIAGSLGGVEGQVIVCGHSHLSRVIGLPDGRLVVNPGSVGLPAYADDLPFAHRMESGSPHARYAIAQRCADKWMIEQIAVPYDWRAAAEAARRNGREDWAAALETGYAAR